MGYQRLIARGVPVWLIVSTVGKLPITMTPLGLVFLVREAPGGYVLGATLAASYVLGEVAGAAGQGMWLRQHRIRSHLAIGFMVGAMAIAALALNPLAPTPVLITLALLAGAGPAASPGGLRSLLTGMVEEAEVPQALSVEVMVSQVIRAVAPALVVRLAMSVSPVAPVALAATSIASAALLIHLLPAPDIEQSTQRSEEPWRTVISGWPIYLTNAADRGAGRFLQREPDDRPHVLACRVLVDLRQP